LPSFNRDLDCLAPVDAAARPLWAVGPTGLDRFLAEREPAQAGFLRDQGFSGATDQMALLPGGSGVTGAVLGLGDQPGPMSFGGLAAALPAGTAWRLEPGAFDTGAALLGFCLGAYRPAGAPQSTAAPTRLVPPAAQDAAMRTARAAWMVRDLINTPANRLGPADLAEAAAGIGRGLGAEASVVAGEPLARDYPTIAAVGAGSERPPQVVVLHWRGSHAHADAPLISLCGKGVCFDTGGYDLKPSSGMLRMKKDMGGAAIALGIARLVMEADLPVRLALRLGCVENSVSGAAMRPLDVLRTRRGLTVEVGNTDAEGRLVLCDLLAEASDERPALLLDLATLTGAARVALGPDLPALFCNDDGWAAALLAAGEAEADPMWRLPLWSGYDKWLASTMADMNNVSSKPMAGAVTAALFLQRFLAPDTPWAHLDLYAWNDETRPGRPEGGEAQAMRAVVAAIAARFAETDHDSNVRIT
jgi:leucyl aminopeptidase